VRASILGFAILLGPGLAGVAGAGLSPGFTPPAEAPAGPAELVVGLAPAPTGAREGAGSSLARAREALTVRLAAAGFSVAATLGEPFAPGGVAAGGVPARSVGPGRTASWVAGEAPPRNPFDLDPDRVLLLRAPRRMATPDALEHLRSDPAIEWAEPNLPRERCEFPADSTLPDDPLFRDTRQWGLWNAGAAGVYRGLAGADIGARAAWITSCGSNDVVLALADTGVDPNHPDLQRLLPGGEPRLAWGRNVSIGSADAWADSNGHGTAVAGVMAALTHDGPHFDSLGVAGVCGGDGRRNAGCRLVPIKVTPGSAGTSSAFEIARAIVYATQRGARAMNLSFAGGGAARVERLALYYAITRGCVVVVSSGNRGHLSPPGVLYPAAFAAEGLCISVGASDARDRRAMFSSYGTALDLVAPGLDVWTTSLTYPNAFGATYRGCLAASGTSFAAPHVAGTIGLMAALRPDLTDSDFQHLLRASAHDVGVAGRDDETGSGRLDAAAALRGIAGTPDRPLALWHDERPAEVRSTGRFAALATAADSFGTFDQGVRWRGRVAERFEARVTIALPDSFADSAQVWPRVGGTMAMRGDFQLDHYAPWAEVAERQGREVTLRGYLYRVPMAPAAGLEVEPDSADSWLPLPPDQARIGFTVFGAVDRAPRTAGLPAAPPDLALRVSPNPARGLVRIAGRPGERVAVFDLAGRCVRRAVLEPTRGAFEWDARDDRGVRVRPGVYLVAPADRRAPARRVVVLDP